MDEEDTGNLPLRMDYSTPVFMKPLTIALIAIPVLVVLWIVGLFNGLYLLPTIEEDYYIDGVGLSQPMILSEEEEQLSLTIPHDTDSLKAIDLMIYSFDEPGNEQKVHILTINNISARLTSENNEVPNTYLYVFTIDGELPGIQAVANYTIENYVNVRYVYNLYKIDKFNFEVSVDYTYDNKPRKVNRTFEVEHKSRFKWQRLRIFEQVKY